MIKIIKNSDEKYVTMGAYKNLYKSMGYQIVTENKPEQKQSFVKPVNQVKEDKSEPVEPKDSKGSDESEKKENNDLRNKQ